MLVGAIDAYAVSVQGIENPRRRVPVVVVADADQGEPGVHTGQQIVVLMRRAVVGDLEHVGRQVWLGAEQGSLRGRFEVAGEQHADAVDVGGDDHAAVVGRRLRRGDEPARPEHLELERRADAPPFTGLCDAHRHTGRVKPVPDLRGVRRRVVQRRDEHLPDGASGEHAGNAGHVVGVEMREHQQRHMLHSERIEATPDVARLRPGIDDHGRPLART